MFSTIKDLTRYFLVYFLSLLLIINPFISYAADGIVPDAAALPQNRPGVDVAQNGVPVVNIVRPDASGLSYNKYSDFNVSEKGAILNNAREIGVSQLGGVLLGNPNFNGTSAKIILNEVTSTNLSSILGAIEIFGDKADFILANPNGITCNGCAFINTPRVALTTGVPDMAGDRLGGFRVSKGEILITGDDINLENVSKFELISRTAKIAAAIYAGEDLSVITGNNYISYENSEVTALGQDANPPVIALDSAAVGGMYAGRIKLIATDAGVGVNSEMVAGVDDVTINAAGEIRYKDSFIKRNLKVSSGHGNILHTGNAYAEGKMEIKTAQGVVTESGLSAAKNDVAITSAGLEVASGAAVVAGVDAVTEGDNTSYRNNNIGQLNINSAAAVVNAGLLTGAKITINAASFNNSSQVQSAGDINIIAGSITNLDNYLVDNLGNITSGINAGGQLSLSANSGNVVNNNGVLTAAKLLTINAAGSLINNSLINADGNIVINAGTVDNSLSYFTDSNGYLNSGIIAAGDVTITSAGVVDNNDGAISASNININSIGQLKNDYGLLGALTAVDIAASGASNEGGSIYAGDNIKINAGAGDFNNIAGMLNTSGIIDINHVATLSNTGLIKSSSIFISGAVINNSNSYFSIDGVLSSGIIASNKIDLTASSSINNHEGAIYSQDIILNTIGLDNSAGLIQATNQIDIIASTINNGATYLKNTAGSLIRGILSNADLKLTSIDINNSNGAINSGAKIDITATGTLSNSGLIQSKTDSDITAGSLINSDNLHLDNNGNLDKGIISGALLNINSGNVNNDNGAIYS